MFFSTEAVSLGSEGEITDSIRFTQNLSHLILLAVIVLLHLLALTTYRFRVFQMRTAVLAAIVTLALQIWIAIDFIQIGSEFVFRLPCVFPAASIILDILAARGILADQLLVESSSSLRQSRRERRSRKRR